MEEKLVTLAILTYSKAQILKNVLENEGIEAYIHNVNLIQPVISSGVRVRIKESDLPRALKGTEGLFKVLLSHDPTHWRRSVLPETDIQLMLSGHTHDMQVSVFGFSASQFVYPEHRGMYLEEGRGLYVNVGLGFVLFPFRLGSWPEITVITLRR